MDFGIRSRWDAYQRDGHGASPAGTQSEHAAIEKITETLNNVNAYLGSRTSRDRRGFSDRSDWARQPALRRRRGRRDMSATGVILSLARRLKAATDHELTDQSWRRRAPLRPMSPVAGPQSWAFDNRCRRYYCGCWMQVIGCGAYFGACAKFVGYASVRNHSQPSDGAGMIGHEFVPSTAP